MRKRKAASLICIFLFNFHIIKYQNAKTRNKRLNGNPGVKKPIMENPGINANTIKTIDKNKCFEYCPIEPNILAAINKFN